jgi:superfamily II DNA or RNA helicase
VLLVLPTGGGKTVAFAYVVGSAVKLGRRVLILVHRVELIDLVAAALGRAGVSYGVVAPGFVECDAPVQIASVAFLARPKRLERWRNKFDLIVVDEAHHGVVGSWAKALDSQSDAPVLGVTATPERLDGRGLGEIFEVIVEGPSTATLIAAGWLCRFVCYEPAAAPDMSGARIRAGDYAVEDLRERMNGVVIGAAVAEYRRLCPGVPSIAFCIDIEHSKAVAAAFVTAGVRAVHVDGDTPDSERRSAIAGLADGSVDVIANVNLFGEGVDVPAIGAAILLRPTHSLALYLQQVGRALRPSASKERASILDFAGNVARHGLPDAPRAWSLDAKPRRQRKKSDGPLLRKCSSCSALNRAGAHECAACGTDLRTPHERTEIEMRLREAQRREQEDAVTRMLPHERWAWAGADEGRLRIVARISHYSRGWVFYQRQRALELLPKAR